MKERSGHIGRFAALFLYFGEIIASGLGALAIVVLISIYLRMHGHQHLPIELSAQLWCVICVGLCVLQRREIRSRMRLWSAMRRLPRDRRTYEEAFLILRRVR